MAGPMAGQCMLSIERRADFCASPPWGFRLDPSSNKIIQEADSVTVMVKDTKIAGRDTVLQVDNISELEAAKDLVFRKPILSTCRCTKPYHREAHRDESHENTSLMAQEDYVVLINTMHPQIKPLFDEAFNRAEQLLRENRLFRIRIAISDSLKVFYVNNVHFHREENNQAQAYNCDIYITHGVSEPSCADNCFACKNAPQTALWCICFPCCLLTGVPFLCYKKCIKNLHESSVGQALPVTYHQGPFQLGFNLLGLLYPPGAQVTTVTQYSQPPLPQQPYYGLNG